MVVDMIDERSKQVLYAIVESYINKPDPVGSRFITKRYSFGFSPATTRNIMADLEEFGFLNQPHTSSGRIPTDKGYRFYVDSLFAQGINDSLVTSSNKDKDLKVHQYEAVTELICEFTKRLEKMKNDINMMFMDVTNTLSLMSNYIGIAIPPKPEKTTFNRVDLIRYKENHVVAILLTNEGIIKSKILRIDSIQHDDLNRIADYLNSRYSGYTLDDIKGMLIKRVEQEKMLWDELITKAIKICEHALSFSDDDIFVSGLYDVMNLPDFSNISKIREIAKAIKDKHLILHLLDELSNSEGVQVVIGNENPIEELKNLSVVSSTYKEGNRPIGVIALVGPTRMNYLKAIYMVDAVAKCLNKIFS